MIRIPGGVLCAGNLTQDILVRPVEEPRFDATAWVETIETSLGGNAANTAYVIGALGGRVRIIGWVGEDEFGERVGRTLSGAGVDVSCLSRSNLPTAATVVLVRGDGARAFLHRPGVSGQAFREPIEFTPPLIEGFTHLHIGNPFALPAMRAHAPECLKRARRAGLTTSLDTGWDSKGQWLDIIGPCLPMLDLLFVNEQEGRQLSGETSPSGMARFFRERGSAACAIKLGAEGCVVFDGAHEIRSPGFRIDVVDTTGAGDSFAGGFLASLQREASPEAAARLANAAGAMSASSLGAVTGIRDYPSMLAWMASTGV